MEITISQNIIKATHEKPGAVIGVAQIRQHDGRRLVREGAVVLVMKDEKGTEVRCLFNPDEATVLGMGFVAAAAKSADMLPPDIVAVPPKEASPVHIIGGKQ